MSDNVIINRLQKHLDWVLLRKISYYIEKTFGYTSSVYEDKDIILVTLFKKEAGYIPYPMVIYDNNASTAIRLHHVPNAL